MTVRRKERVLLYEIMIDLYKIPYINIQNDIEILCESERKEKVSTLGIRYH